MPIWTRRKGKPNLGVGIDWDHPLAQGMVAAYPINEGAGPNIRDLGPYGLHLLEGTPASAYSWPGSDVGTSYRRNVGSGGKLLTAQVVPYAAELTVMADFVDSRSDNFGVICELYSDSGGNPLSAYWGGSTTFHLSSAFPAVDLTLATSQTTRHTYALVAGKAAYEIWIDGAKQATTAGSSTGFYTGYFPSRFYLGCNTGGQDGNPTFRWCYLWSRVLSPGEILSITADPWQIFAPQRAFWLMNPAAAGATITAATGAFTFTGNDANLLVGRLLGAGTGSFALTGNDAGLLVSRALAAETGVYVVTGRAANLVWSGEVVTPTLTFRETLLAKLESIPGVTAIVGTAIYPGALPMTHDLGADGAAITYTVATYARGHVLTGSDGTATARVQFSAWSYDAAESDAITLAIWDALDRIPVNPWVAGGVEITGVVQVDESDQFEPPRAGGDQWVYQIVSEYAISHRTIIS